MLAIQVSKQSNVLIVLVLLYRHNAGELGYSAISWDTNARVGH
jgi:hypothetical protein